MKSGVELARSRKYMGYKWHMEKWEVSEHNHDEGGAGTCAVERYTKIPTVPLGGEARKFAFLKRHVPRNWAMERSLVSVIYQYPRVV